MKSERLMWISVAVVFSVMASAGPLTAQQKPRSNKHHHYQLIDLGTFGGPQSFTQEELKFLNGQGTVAGTADTPTLDPNYPNSCFFCGPYIDHAFLWKNGSLTDLGALPGLNTSGAFGISNGGLSVGFSENGEIDPLLGLPEVRAVLWKGGHILDLGTLEGGYESAAFQVNSRGQVAGVSFTNIPDQFTGVRERTFLWDAQNGMQDLGTLGTGTDAGLLGFKGNVEINDRGQVAGCSFTNTTVNPVTGAPTLDPFLWDKQKGMEDLGTLGGTSGCPLNLNNHGQVVGYSNVAGDLTLHPFLWTTPGPMRDLGTLGGTFGYAVWANEAGEVVGTSTIQGDGAVHGFLWKRGKLIDLGALNSLPNSSAEWINSREQIVGNAHSSDGSTFLAVLWENSGPAVDLNTLVASGSDLLLTIAHNINDRGEIGIGGVTSDGNNHAVLLIPCDEHHPGIESCDYSMAEASPAVPIQPTLRAAPGSTLPAALWPGRNRLLKFAIMSPSETTVTVSPTSLVFSTQALGTASLGKKVTLENTGTTTVNISSIAIIGTNAGDFFISATTCGTSLPAGASCTVKVKFKPTEPGMRSGVLSFTDNGVGSPQKVTLSGIGTTAKLYPADVNFGSVAIGTTSSPQTVTLTNVGMSTLTITGIAIRGTDAGDFAQINDCGTSLAAGASCSISVSFKPTLSGTRTAALKVSDNGGGSPQSVSLRGYGVGSCKRFGYTCDPNIPHQCCSGLQCVFTGGPFYVWRCE